ncbi:MAG: TonB-dependent receptor [Verrucomicrobiales bacterium]|jgi:vitamin B12 transporter|nr:TonB-dependent receptor [Verrucomicrobiales bacterium]
MLKHQLTMALSAVLLASPVIGQETTSQPVTGSGTAAATTSGTTAIASSGTVKEYPEVLVQATRLEGAPFQGGVTSSVITSDDIQRRQFRTLQDVLSTTPGISLAASGPGQNVGVFTRGLDTNMTQFQIDGRRMPTDFSGAFAIQNITLDNVQQIEFLRGPLSSVQGANAAGGVVNIITQSGKGLEKPEYVAGFEAGSYNTFRETVSARGQAGNFDYSAQFSDLDTSNQRRNNDQQLANFITRNGYQITDDLYVDLFAFYNYSEVGLPGPDYTPSLTEGLLRENWLISPGVTWQTTDWWKQTLFYAHSELRQVAYGYSALSYTPNSRIQVDTEQVDYQSTFQVAEKWKIAAGLSLTADSYYRKPSSGFTAGTKDVKNSQTVVSPFVQTEWEPLDGWTLNGSVRLDHDSDFGNPITWRIGSSYRVPKLETLLHASYGTSYTPPSPQLIAGAFYGNPRLEPAYSSGFDVGVEQPFLDKKLTVGATYFHNDITDYFLSDPMTWQTENIGKVSTQGVELTLTARPIDELTLTAAYTYLDANNRTDDVRLLRRPRNQFSFTVTGQPHKDVTVSVGGLWVVDRQDYNQNYAQVRVEDYFVARVAASWQVNQHVQIFARLENAFNEQYADVYGYPALDQAVYGGFKISF